MSGPPNEELQEKNFIQEGYQKNPKPFWTWLFVLAALMGILWAITSWYYNSINTKISISPFLQVTNRELSLFLWQFPERMRVNQPNKANYLTGFNYKDKVSLVVEDAEKYAVAPPDLLFLYHTWNRLLKSETSIRPIPKDLFQEFLDKLPEWQPNYWPNAPAAYNDFVKKLATTTTTDLNTLPETVLPYDVRIAFQGWRNYFLEGEAIDKVSPTLELMRAFLMEHPHYARNYWRNIVMESKPKYLVSLSNQDLKGDTPIPSDELTAFLKVAFYNYLNK